jgi:hypothetical protein
MVTRGALRAGVAAICSQSQGKNGVGRRAGSRPPGNQYRSKLEGVPSSCMTGGSCCSRATGSRSQLTRLAVNSTTRPPAEPSGADASRASPTDTAEARHAGAEVRTSTSVLATQSQLKHHSVPGPDLRDGGSPINRNPTVRVAKDEFSPTSQGAKLKFRRSRIKRPLTMPPALCWASHLFGSLLTSVPGARGDPKQLPRRELMACLV